MKEFWFNDGWYSLMWIEIHSDNSIIAHMGQWLTKEDIQEFPTSPIEVSEYDLQIDTSDLFNITNQKLVAEEGPFFGATEEHINPIDEMQSLLNEVTSILTDEQADQIPQAFSEWKAGIVYPVGQRVRYNDELWRCIQAHTSQEGWEPSETPSLWTRTHQEDEIPEWIQPLGAADAYSTGDKVKHLNKTWESTVNDNVWEPGVYGWTEVTE